MVKDHEAPPGQPRWRRAGFVLILVLAVGYLTHPEVWLETTKGAAAGLVIGIAVVTMRHLGWR